LIYTLTAMSKDEAEALGVGEVERKSIFRVDPAKVNIAPPDATTRWFRLIGVHIGNGTADYPSGDNVQACEPWKPASLFDGLTTGDLNKALQKLGAGMGDGRRYSAAPNARDRAAWKAVKDQFPGVEPARCKAIVTIWLKNGVFEIGEYEDAQRKPTVGILAAKLIGEGTSE
jgi:hypothetical protein